jgi:dihydroorotase
MVHNESLSLTQLLAAMSTKPAELLGLPGGSLRNGAPADLIVIDPDTSWVLEPSDLKSKCKNTPFDEARLEGRVVRTIVAGRTAYEYASA